MKTVLHGLREMEASLRRNEPELEALDQIEVLRAKLIDRPGAIEMLARLQEECAPDAEKTKMELEMIREAIQIVEDQSILPEPELDPVFDEESVSNLDSEQLVVQQPA
ncbi:MAG: hypothetical protein HY735_32420 [Verrucomicrobia bacterium]|nr:hypothetical protein [Verrucomicrobiota bacterium]